MPAEAASSQHRSIARRGIMLVVSSPSGAGKTTLTRNLIEQEKHITLSVSVTTRPRRPSEIDGVHYHFISKRRFDIMRDSAELLEWAEVHGNCYGTPREPVEQALAAGRDVLFDIDWQGTRQLYDAMRDDVVSVFVLPPSAAELKARLERRAEDSDEIIVKRLRNAAEEIAHWPEYDYVLVNRDLDKSFLRLRSILTAERLKRVHRADMESFVEGLLDGLREITA
ncbi:guanylate kinase [Rhodoplanes sp. TEM]|uniref:Guanylate kinase n=1 Tax=Rhodoplanes tepidamans TaxID=200616 RepID=A0ABT5JHC4_RHOTP|nr:MULTISPECIES: guanylate kinase [Rhodoplanes]MDC7788982.1 guanylate kinase [Rhodoplanes tepidamans]MDC7986373.1 guanylate kinase [Rhodoplanes sp. TEM]MDQ0355695.1 guanylate kinase [Rhodoplanes tepidamans]